MKIRLCLLGALIGIIMAVVPIPALAWGSPGTLAVTETFGSIDGRSAIERSSFPIDYLGTSWTAGAEPHVRFLVDGKWSRWVEAHQDDLPTTDGRTYSSLLDASSATAYQLRGENVGVKAVAINTTDGPRPLVWEKPFAQASHISQPAVISRPEWGADESYRFESDGTEKWPPAFYATQKLIVHHTATENDDSDPAATVRAIYRYHAVDKGWGDIGYNFLVDAQGRIYKGRYSGPAGTWYEDTLTGESPEGLGVTAAHVGGYNSGTMGIAVLGTYRTVALPEAARAAVVEHLSWESERHGLDPLGSSAYVNPVNGATKQDIANISGHRDWASTECPGTKFYNDLPSIRQDVAAKIGGDNAISLTATGLKSKGLQKVDLSWTGAPADGTIDLWRKDGVGSYALTGTATSDAAGAGTYRDNIDKKGGGTYTYKICPTGSSSGCSNEATVVF